MLPGKALSLISAFLEQPSASRHVSSSAVVKTNRKARPVSAATSNELEGTRTDRSQVLAIIFSKDRPGQVHACVSSILENVTGLDKIMVVYKATNTDSARRYREAIERFYHKRGFLRWIHEDDYKGFLPSLRFALERSACDTVWFQVDDAIHYSQWNCAEAASLLHLRGDVLNVHAKLWQGAVRCHPAKDARMHVPDQFERWRDGHLLFLRSAGTMDWNYPFDLSGGLYRRSLIEEMLASFDPHSIANPNQLEVAGNAFVSLSRKCILMPLSACVASPSPVFSIVTINRVQSEFDNAVYASEFGAEPPWTNLTDRLFTQPIDFRAFQTASLKYDACHVGDLFTTQSVTEVGRVDVSILVPVRNAEKTLWTALTSIVDVAECDRDKPLRMEMIIVDDASTDGSVWVAKEFQNMEKGRRTGVDVKLLLRPKSSGQVVDCLEFGLSHCRGEFIVRMDADDVSFPGRIGAQIRQMKRRPRLGVLGTRTQVVRGSEVTEAPTPRGAASLAWSLFFFCPLVHPSVCIRREALEAGYGRSSKQPTSMEDYHLWHILFSGGKWILDNSDFLGLQHCKHSRSVTAKWSPKDRDLEQATIALDYARQRSDALKMISAEIWMVACRPNVINMGALGELEVSKLLAGLEELKMSILDQFHGIIDEADKAFVERDCEARKLEIRLLGPDNR